MSQNLDESLKKQYSIPERYHDCGVYLLEQFVDTQGDPRLFSRIVNSLRKSNITTVGQLLNATGMDMIRVKGMGPQSHELLHSALAKAAATDDWAYELGAKPKPVKKKPDLIDKLKQRYLNRLKNQD
jgi:DNA-directed RNA polymerase alpha subunit